jgi:hypothetical protein
VKPNTPALWSFFLDGELFSVEVKVKPNFFVGSFHGDGVAALIGRAASRLSIFFVLLLERSLAGRVDMSTIFYSFF